MEFAVFNTQDSTLERFDGAMVTVLGPVSPETYDFEEVGPMFRIILPNQEVTEAFADELTVMEVTP